MSKRTHMVLTAFMQAIMGRKKGSKQKKPRPGAGEEKRGGARAGAGRPAGAKNKVKARPAGQLSMFEALHVVDEDLDGDNSAEAADEKDDAEYVDWDISDSALSSPVSYVDETGLDEVSPLVLLDGDAVQAGELFDWDDEDGDDDAYLSQDDGDGDDVVQAGGAVQLGKSQGMPSKGPVLDHLRAVAR